MTEKTYFVEGIVTTKALLKVEASNPQEAKNKVENAREKGLCIYGNIEVEATGFRNKDEGAEEDFNQLSNSQGVL